MFPACAFQCNQTSLQLAPPRCTLVTPRRLSATFVPEAPMTRIRSIALLTVVLAIACHQNQPKSAPTPVAPPPAPAGRGVPARPPPAPGDSGAPGVGRGGRGGAGVPSAEPNPQPYGQVVTPRGHRRKSGLFKTDRIGDSPALRDPAQRARPGHAAHDGNREDTAGLGYGGQTIAAPVVRWERRDNRILLREMNYGLIASDTADPVTVAVANANYAPIIAGVHGRVVRPRFCRGDQRHHRCSPPRRRPRSASDRGTAATWMPNRTLLSSVAAVSDQHRSPLRCHCGPARCRRRGRQSGRRPWRSSATAPQPDVPGALVDGQAPRTSDEPRLNDARVGLLHEEHDRLFPCQCRNRRQRTFITRYRLECSDQKVGNLCVPKKPIMYYVDPATPRWLVPWIKKAITDWQPAFEAAGFKNGIVAKEAPSQGRGPRLVARGCALCGHRLAAVDHRERRRSAHRRSAYRRDHQRATCRSITT